MPPSELEILGQPGLDLQPAINWYRRGGVAGSLGMQPVDQALAAAGSQPLTIGSDRDIMPAIMSGIDSPMLGFGVGSIKGYHGTPHTFAPEPGAPLGRFKNEAIGTGEGAQTYGYGHYVAGNKGVAAGYKKDLTEKDFMQKVRESYGEGDSPDDAHEALMESPDLNQNHKDLLTALKNDDWLGFDYPHQAVRAALREPENFELSPETQKALNNFGSLLEVHILPDEHELLDWDKTLNQQSPEIQKLLSPLTSRLPDNGNGWTGQMLYQNLSRQKHLERYPDTTSMKLGNDKAASEALHEAGIPGIKYLDAGSRRAGEGTHNYVIFHPDNLRIIGRNGQRLEPVDHDPFGSAP